MRWAEEDEVFNLIATHQNKTAFGVERRTLQNANAAPVAPWCGRSRAIAAQHPPERYDQQQNNREGQREA